MIQGDTPDVWYCPEVIPHVNIEWPGQKRYVVVWFHDDGTVTTEWSWALHSSARRLVEETP
jgi:hypothetical protein